MRYLFKVVLAIAGTLMCLSAANIAFPKNNHPTTFLGPTLRGTYTDSYNAYTAYSLAGEAGLKNFRVGGTVGWQFAENQRLKLSAEYLWQKITYSFFTGNTDEWVQQGAIGGLYQYRFCYDCWDPTFDLRAFYSHAPSKRLSTASGFLTTGGVLQPISSRRRIAGSDGAGIAPGVTIRPWCGTNFGLDLNYDNVRYDNHNHSNQDAVGFGGTARLSQVLMENLILNASAAIRQPFNSYEASVNWANISFYGLWSVGLAGDYTAGKHTLPSTWNVAVIGNYFVDQTCDSACQRRAACQFTKVSCDPPGDFLTWASDPAVYLPQVLAIPDEDIVCSAPPPVAISTLTLDDVTGTSTINTSVAFTPGSGLTYSIVAITPTPSPGQTVTINSTTGVVTAVNGAGTTNTVVVTIGARNICGATTTTTLTVNFVD